MIEAVVDYWSNTLTKEDAIALEGILLAMYGPKSALVERLAQAHPEGSKIRQ
jgi:hypothetical protein